ncbi:MAG: hypothetical protein OEM96_05670 [Gemmatimonadota bacterium]|nr:hypothetical protein [Gemmatimonadota bacterium]
MWSNRIQVEGKSGPGLVMPVLFPFLVATVLAVWALYGSALNRTVSSINASFPTSEFVVSPDSIRG